MRQLIFEILSTFIPYGPDELPDWGYRADDKTLENFAMSDDEVARAFGEDE